MNLNLMQVIYRAEFIFIRLISGKNIETKKMILVK